jgi:hypothetical protein
MWIGGGADTLSFKSDGGSTGNTMTIARYWEAIMHSFATRLQWTIKPPAECNHSPLVKVKNNKTGDYTIDFASKPGDVITLTAEGYDLDGHMLGYTWWRYAEADTYAGSLAITSYVPTCTFTVPADAVSGNTIHAIIEVRDNPGQGQLPLTKWARVIVRVN